MKTTICLAVLSAAAIAACSPLPDAIAPAPAYGAFDNLSCAEAQQQLAAVSKELYDESQKQIGAATMDAVGVFFVLVPVSKLTGQDHQGLIAADKGKVDALNARLATCG